MMTKHEIPTTFQFYQLCKIRPKTPFNPHQNRMSKYNANVRIGNWYYDLMLQEEKAKQYMRKTKNAELKVQKTRLAFVYMLKEIPLTFPVVGLSYGAIIQIVSPDVPDKLINKIKEKQGIALGADIPYSQIDKRFKFAQGDLVIGTGLMTPCVRNVWMLVPDDNTQEGKELRFGDSFHLKLCGADIPLYIEGPIQSPGVLKGESGHVTPKLIGYQTTLTRFKVVNSDPRLRYETEGSIVPPFERIAIIQGASSESLAVETDTWFPTYYGMECEVSIHTYKTLQDPKKPDPRNYWCFILSA